MTFLPDEAVKRQRAEHKAAHLDSRLQRLAALVPEVLARGYRAGQMHPEDYGAMAPILFAVEGSLKTLIEENIPPPPPGKINTTSVAFEHVRRQRAERKAVRLGIKINRTAALARDALQRGYRVGQRHPDDDEGLDRLRDDYYAQVKVILDETLEDHPSEAQSAGAAPKEI